MASSAQDGGGGDAAMAAAEAERKKRVMTSVQLHSFLAVVQHVATLQTEPMLVRAVCGGDAAAASRLLGVTSSSVGLLGLVVNQLGGKVSDSLGRKPLMLLGPLVNLVAGLTVFLRSGSKSTVLSCRIFRSVVTTLSGTIMTTAVLTDIFSPKDFPVAVSKIGASIGLGVIVGPVMEAAILKRSGGSLRHSYLGLSVLGALNFAISSRLMHESLPLAKRRPKMEISKILRDINPFSFIKLLTSKDAVFNRLMQISALQTMLDGKNLSDIGQLYQRQMLKWDIASARNYAVAWGITVALQGAVIVPALLKKLGVHSFTTLGNGSLFLGLCMQGLTGSGAWYTLGMAAGVPGMNAASCNGLRGLANGYVAKAGIGGGEFSAMWNNLRAVVGALSTSLFGFFFAWCTRRGLNSGLTFVLAAACGAALPQALLWQFARDYPSVFQVADRAD